MKFCGEIRFSRKGLASNGLLSVNGCPGLSSIITNDKNRLYGRSRDWTILM